MIALLILAATLASHEPPASRAPSGLGDRETAAASIEGSFRSAGIAPASDVAPFLDGYRHRFDLAWAELDPGAAAASIVVQRGAGTTSFQAIAIRSAPSTSRVEPTDQVFLVDSEDLGWLGSREDTGTISLPGGVVVAIQRGSASAEKAPEDLADQARGALRLGASALILVETSPTVYAAPAPGPPPDLLMLRAGPDLAIDLVGRQELSRLAAPKLIEPEPGFRPILLDLMIGASGPFRRRQSPAVSLVGYLRGADPVLSREAVLVTTRYGTADSSAGVASLLEIGREFASPAKRPSRSLLLAALDGEELDLAGSQALSLRTAEMSLALAAVVEIGPPRENDPFRVAGLPTFNHLPGDAEMATRTVRELAR